MPNAKANLLIVDDETAIRTLLSYIFRQLGYSVRVAEDGFAALEQLREKRTDILVSDLDMPRMSGFELLSVVRRRRPDIYVVASSGAFSGSEVPTGIAADAFHKKGTGLPSLLELVQAATSPATLLRAGSRASLPIWISPERIDAVAEVHVLLTCPECLRAFSHNVGPADFVIHQASCVHCTATIHYATVQPTDPADPLRFSAPGETLPLQFPQQGSVAS